ncbi:hypothetical protein JMG10_00525 [Nostoc ellipsosporum NOK]|nr:hypothetical protein [Nostoc ellipsosporum NOK]
MPRGDGAIDICALLLRGYQTRLSGRKTYPPEERYLSLILFRNSENQRTTYFPGTEVPGFFYFNLMRIYFLLLFVLFKLSAHSQSGFPEKWKGHWKGKIAWYKTGADTATMIDMQLKIFPTDSAHNWTWQLIYGNAEQDDRPYTLIAKDTAKGLWVIDENNGIVLTQYWVGNRFTGIFTVQGTTILNSYYLDKDELVVEFYVTAQKPSQTTGMGTTDSPLVDSYPVRAIQRGRLVRER